MALDRTSLLNQVAAGRLSAEAAARSLTAKAGPVRWLHVRVTKLATGAPRVSVNLPLAWAQAGLKLGARYQPELAGVDWDAVVAQLEAGVVGPLVEVEDFDRGERVVIYVE